MNSICLVLSASWHSIPPHRCGIAWQKCSRTQMSERGLMVLWVHRKSLRSFEFSPWKMGAKTIVFIFGSFFISFCVLWYSQFLLHSNVCKKYVFFVWFNTKWTVCIHTVNLFLHLAVDLFYGNNYYSIVFLCQNVARVLCIWFNTYWTMYSYSKFVTVFSLFGHRIILWKHLLLYVLFLQKIWHVLCIAWFNKIWTVCIHTGSYLLFSPYGHVSYFWVIIASWKDPWLSSKKFEGLYLTTSMAWHHN